MNMVKTEHIQSLFQKLIWPAAAGNVVWAFFAVVTNRSTNVDTSPFAVVLFFVASYLVLDWLFVEMEKAPLQPWFWVFDSILAVALVVFSIAAEGGLEWSTYVLLGAFAVAFAGHYVGAWEPASAKKKRKSWFRIRMFLAWTNFAGIVVLYWLRDMWPWNLASAMGSVVAAYVLFQLFIFRRWP